jgi:hypothetical protein
VVSVSFCCMPTRSYCPYSAFVGYYAAKDDLAEGKASEIALRHSQAEFYAEICVQRERIEYRITSVVMKLPSLGTRIKGAS